MRTRLLPGYPEVSASMAIPHAIGGANEAGTAVSVTLLGGDPEQTGNGMSLADGRRLSRAISLDLC